MKIAHIISATDSKLSGPRNSVTLLVKYLSKIKASNNFVFSTQSNTPFVYNGTVIYPLHRMEINKFDLIILNGIYDVKLMDVAKRARRLNLKYAFCPRVGLMIDSLKKSWYKKIPYIIYHLNLIYNANTLIFLTHEERGRSLFGHLEKSIVCGNIVDRMPLKFNQNRKKIIRFIGRLDVYHKGLDLLMDAVSIVSNDIRSSSWSVHLHGPDHKSNLEKLKKKVYDNKIDDIVFFHPEVYEVEKYKLLNESSVFVHTSRYEGQPQAVMEAMSYGNALLVTPGTNMKSIIEKSNCGYVCNFSKEEISIGILKIIGLPENQIASMQFNSFNFAKKEFAGDGVANKFFKYLSKV
jgi:glycosyltransferase involved in cell wall biosynthesis